MISSKIGAVMTIDVSLKPKGILLILTENSDKKILVKYLFNSTKQNNPTRQNKYAHQNHKNNLEFFSDAELAPSDKLIPL